MPKTVVREKSQLKMLYAVSNAMFLNLEPLRKRANVNIM